MTTPSQAPAPKSRKIVPGETLTFPCWLGRLNKHAIKPWQHFDEKPNDKIFELATHWHPDQPEAPPERPDALTDARESRRQNTEKNDALVAQKLAKLPTSPASPRQEPPQEIPKWAKVPPFLKICTYRPYRIIARDPKESTYEKGDDKFETFIHCQSKKDAEAVLALHRAARHAPPPAAPVEAQGGKLRAALEEIRARLPAKEYVQDGLTARELKHIIAFVDRALSRPVAPVGESANKS